MFYWYYWCFLIQGVGKSPIGIGTEAQVSYGFSNFVQKRGTQNFGYSSRRQGLKDKEYLGLRYWKVRRVTLSTDRDLVLRGLVEVLCFKSAITTNTTLTTTITATSTATTTASATAKRLFEVLRVYCLVILSTDRGLVVLRFCKEEEELRGAAVYWAFLLWIEVLV